MNKDRGLLCKNVEVVGLIIGRVSNVLDIQRFVDLVQMSFIFSCCY